MICTLQTESLSVSNYLEVPTLQLLDSVSKKPASADETFAKKSVVEKKNRYKDRFPCELRGTCLHLVAIEA